MSDIDIFVDSHAPQLSEGRTGEDVVDHWLCPSTAGDFKKRDVVQTGWSERCQMRFVENDQALKGF